MTGSDTEGGHFEAFLWRATILKGRASFLSSRRGGPGRRRPPATVGQFIGKAPFGAIFVMSHNRRGDQHQSCQPVLDQPCKDSQVFVKRLRAGY